MKSWFWRIALGLAVVLLVVSLLNASWLAAAPQGAIKLIAHRGVSQIFDDKGIGRDSCTATRIEPPVHDYLENTLRSIEAARQMGADMVEIDIAPTADGHIALFHDWTVDCRTEGKSEARSKTLAELKALDPGFGYTADNGRTFPLRGKQKGSIPSLDEALKAFPTTPLLFNFKSNDPGEADLLAAVLTANGRDPVKSFDGFYGGRRPVERMRELYPGAWAWSMDGMKACTKAYLLYGWTTIVPESCRNGTIMVPLNYQWAYWGWPNRLIQRMNKVGAKVVVIGPRGSDAGMGLTLPEQLGKVPSTFRGYIWVEDIWTVGPALRPDRDMRTKAQQDAAEAGLQRRRERG